MITDPLNEMELEVTDVATARYALKTANDYHFAQIHMREQMERELMRSALEVTAQKRAIVNPYLKEMTAAELSNVNYEIYSRSSENFIEIYAPTTPAAMVRAFKELDAGLAKERERAESELAENSVELLEMENYLEEKAGAWFKSEIGRPWLAGRNAVTLGGCTMVADGDEITFTFEEQDYD